MKKALILANGDPPKLNEIKYLQKIGYKRLICSDGGANSARRLKILPDLIIGDLDSITDETRKYFSNKCKTKKIARQNDTDVEKALKYLIGMNYQEVVLLGATGNRLDHSICNLGIVLKYFYKINVSILHRKSFLSPYTGELQMQTQKNEIISLYGFDRKTKISVTGLKFPINNEALPFGAKESTSNVANGDNITLKIKGGVIFLIRDFNILRKYDLLQSN